MAKLRRSGQGPISLTPECLVAGRSLCRCKGGVVELEHLTGYVVQVMPMPDDFKRFARSRLVKQMIGLSISYRRDSGRSYHKS